MNRREFLKGAFAFAIAPSLPMSFHLQPLGERIDEDALALVKRSIREVYGGIILTEELRRMPMQAYYEPRQRYRTRPTWEYLKALGYPGITVGLTHMDISQPSGEHPDWGVFGVGQQGVALLSTYRIRKNFEHRLQLIATHEIGHAMQMDHCEERNCTMRDLESEASRLEEMRFGYFCDAHRR